MNHVMERYFAGRGLSEGKFKILMLLFDAKDHSLSPTELAKQSNVTKATITGLLDGLVRTVLSAARIKIRINEKSALN